jgi:hypothetical protein
MYQFYAYTGEHFLSNITVLTVILLFIIKTNRDLVASTVLILTDYF